jgi:hypothetical protein
MIILLSLSSILQGILNKLTPDNFERLSQQLLDVGITEAKTLIGLIAQVRIVTHDVTGGRVMSVLALCIAIAMLCKQELQLAALM